MFGFSLLADLGIQFNDKDFDEKFAVFQAKKKAEFLKEKIAEIKKIKTPWIKRQKQNYIRIKNEPILSTASSIFLFCTKTSLMANSSSIKAYLLNSFPDWATQFDAKVFFDEALSPSLDYYNRRDTISFSATNRDKNNTPNLREYEQAVKDKFEELNDSRISKKIRKQILKESIPPYSVDIHLSVPIDKESVLRFIDENWGFIQWNFNCSAPEPRFGKKYTENLIVRSLLPVIRPTRIIELTEIEDQLYDFNISREDIFKESAKLRKQREGDQFRFAVKELAEAIKTNQKFMSSITKLYSESFSSDKNIDIKSFSKIIAEFGRFDLILDEETNLFHLKKSH